MKTFKILIYALALTLGSSLGVSSFAFTNNFSDLFVPVVNKGESGKNRAAAKAKAKHGGKVLSVSEIKKGEKTVYKVKLLLDSGRIKIVTLDK